MLFYVEAHPDATSAELEHEFLWLADDYENANGTFVAAYMAAMANPYVQEQLAVQSANAPNAPAMFATVNPIYPKPGPELPAPLPPVPVVPNQILGCPPGLLDCPIVKHISDKPEYFIIYDRYFEYDIFTVHNLHPNGYPFEVQFTYQEVTTEEWEGVGMPVFLGVRNSYKNGAKKLKDYKEVRDLNKQLSDNNALYASVCLALATIPSQQYLISGFAVYAYYTIKYKGLADDAQTWVRHYDETELPILYRQITTGDELPKLLDEKVSASVPWVIPIQSGNVTTLPPVNTRLPSPQSGFDLTTGWEWIDQHVTVVGNTRNEAIGKLPSELQTLFRSATGF